MPPVPMDCPSGFHLGPFCYPFFRTSRVCVCVCVCACVRLCVFGSLTLQWQGPYGPKCETENISLPYSLIHGQGRRAEAIR